MSDVPLDFLIFLMAVLTVSLVSLVYDFTQMNAARRNKNKLKIKQKPKSKKDKPL